MAESTASHFPSFSFPWKYLSKAKRCAHALPAVPAEAKGSSYHCVRIPEGSAARKSLVKWGAGKGKRVPNGEVLDYSDGGN